MIRAQAEALPVAMMCRLLGVAPSGYYGWRACPESDRTRNDRVLLVQIKAVFAQYRKTYGSRRVHRELREDKVACGRNRVARLMHVDGLRAKQRRKFKPTTDSDHGLKVAPNRLRDHGAVTQPDQVWVTDITYIPTQEGWLYLAAAMDLYSRRIVGWAIRRRLTRQLTLDALRMAVNHRRPHPGLIHHSDRGSQYASRDYQSALQEQGMIPSMSGRGNCYDNATMESFFHSLKVERVHGQRYQTRQEAITDLFEYIEAFYNRKRRHSSLGYLSPARFEEIANAA